MRAPSESACNSTKTISQFAGLNIPRIVKDHQGRFDVVVGCFRGPPCGNWSQKVRFGVPNCRADQRPRATLQAHACRAYRSAPVRACAGVHAAIALVALDHDRLSIKSKRSVLSPRWSFAVVAYPACYARELVSELLGLPYLIRFWSWVTIKAK